MGKKNRERRAAKRRRQRSRPGPPRRPRSHGANPPPSGVSAPPTVEDLAWQAVHAAPDGAQRRILVAALDERGQAARTVLQRMLTQAAAVLWQRGWTPAEAVHVVKRSLSQPHADLLASVAVAELRGRLARGEVLHPRLEAQLAVLAEQVTQSLLPHDTAVLVATLAVVVLLPDVPGVIPAEGDPLGAARSAGVRLDERMLARVRALLAKAESTDFSEEAEALTAKAQELIARHAIDVALLAAGDESDEPSMRRILLDDPYADAKAMLVTVVAGANRCRVVQSPALAWCTVFGFDSDLDAVELLVVSLLTQATRAMAAHGPRRDARGRSTTRSFRRAFLLGFAHRIGQRLKEATDAQVAATEVSRERLLPVLASRDERVQAAEEAMFPRLERRATSVSNASGWMAGQVAADLAHLGSDARSLRAS